MLAGATLVLELESFGGGNLVKRKVFNLQSSDWDQIEGIYISYMPNSSILKNGYLLWYLTENIKYTLVKYVFFANFFGISVNIVILCLILEH